MNNNTNYQKAIVLKDKYLSEAEITRYHIAKLYDHTDQLERAIKELNEQIIQLKK